MQATDLWDDYRHNGGLDARNRLIEENLALVHHVARKLASGRPGEDLDELVSAGTLGLMEAVEKFEPERGLAFSTFAAQRIRGAMLDDRRRRDHAPRSVRRKQRDLVRSRERLTAALGREPREGEIAEDLGLGTDELHRWRRDTRVGSLLSLDAPAGDESDDSAPTREEMLAGEDGEALEEVLTQRQELSLVRDAILELKERERTVLSLYYFEELKLHQIAGILGVTESRISQIRTKALKTLRERLAPLREEVA